MKRLRYRYLFLLGGGLLLGSCSSESQSSAEHDQNSEQAHLIGHVHEEEEEHVVMERLQEEIIGLKLGGFEEKVLRPTLKLTGTLEIPPNNRAEVNSLMAGQVSKTYIIPGQYIKKGGLLATLRNTELVDWQQAYLRTLGSLTFLESEKVRQKELAEKEAVAVKQYEKVRAEYAMALAEKKGLEAKFQMLGIPFPTLDSDLKASIPIRSPISGYLKEIHVAIGTYVSVDEPLFEIVNNHHIHADLRAFEKDLPLLSVGQKLEFSIQSAPDHLYKANIISLGKALDPHTRTTTVHAEIEENTDHLLPGMYVEARVITGKDQAVKSLPESAVITDKELHYIFILDENLGT